MLQFLIVASANGMQPSSRVSLCVFGVSELWVLADARASGGLSWRWLIKADICMEMSKVGGLISVITVCRKKPLSNMQIVTCIIYLPARTLLLYISGQNATESLDQIVQWPYEMCSTSHLNQSSIWRARRIIYQSCRTRRHVIYHPRPEHSGTQELNV